MGFGKRRMKLEKHIVKGNKDTTWYYWVEKGKRISPEFNNEGWAKVWHAEYKESKNDKR